MAGSVQGRNGDKQMGCMSGFLQIFDRQQILAGKRIHSTKRLPPSTGVGGSPETVSSGESGEFSRELGKPEPLKHVVPESPDACQSSPAENVTGQAKSPVLVQTKLSTWKLCKEMPRLSFDSRGTVDGDDNQRRSPSVIARLMGLESLSSSDHKPAASTVAKPALRRSASESRVLRDLARSKYIDGSNFQVKQPNQSQKRTVEKIDASNRDSANGKDMKSVTYRSGNLKAESSRASPWRSRSFFDSNFFPEPNQPTVSMHGDFEKKLKIRGMNEQSNDLSTLKQILEVLQLKGLLHSTRYSNRDDQRNIVNDRHLASDESSVVLMKPSRSPAEKLDNQRPAHESRGTRRYAGENSPSVVDRNGRSPVRARTSSPNRIESNLKRCNSIIKKKPLSIEIEKRASEPSDSVRSSPINSAKLTPKRTGSVHHSITNRSPRNLKPIESSSIVYSKQKLIKNLVTEDDTERLKCEGYREGKRLLQRCDKLLHSIAEMNSTTTTTTTESPPNSAAVLPSPVSVLNSGFDQDESSSPSDCIDFKATAGDYEEWSPTILPTKSTQHREFTVDDPDFIYISKILHASPNLHEDPNVFFSIEKQTYNTENTTNVSKCHRKLVFDVILEIIERNRHIPPWKASIEDSRSSVEQIWSEFQKIREINTGDGLLDLVSGVLKKDLVDIKCWGDHPIEKSETILDIERMIFKDLVSEAIRDLAEFSGEFMFLRTRRRLVF